MRKILLALLLTATMLMAGCTGDGDGEWSRVGASDFANMLNDDSTIFLLDVRTQYEWEEDGHIDGATLIPHDQIDAQKDDLPADKDTPILLYCRSGNRSQTAAKSLLDLGYTNVTDLNSGITGWKDAGYSVTYGV